MQSCVLGFKLLDCIEIEGERMRFVYEGCMVIPGEKDPLSGRSCIQITDYGHRPVLIRMEFSSSMYPVRSSTGAWICFHLHTLPSLNSLVSEGLS